MLIALLVMKPEDIPIIIKNFQQFKAYFTNVKNQALSYMVKELKITDYVDDNILDNDIEELNFYLQRIINIEGHYDGDYSVEKLKTKYYELIKARIKEFDY